MLVFNRFFFLRFHDVVFSLVNLALPTLVTAYAIIFAASFVLLWNFINKRLSAWRSYYDGKSKTIKQKTLVPHGKTQGPVFQKVITANPELDAKRGLNFASLKHFKHVI